MSQASRTLLAILVLTLAAPLPPAAAADAWVHLGPFGGAVFEVEIAPSAHRTLYVSGSAGVYRSDDAAAHWHAAWEGLPPSVRALAVDPTAAGIVYAGVLSPVTPEAASLYKSVDRGVTWAPLGVSGEGIYDIAIDPHDPERILAAGQTGLFRSEDGGETWSRSEVNAGAPPSAYLDSVAFDPSAPGVAYIASSNLGFLKSVDGGLTWTRKVIGVSADRLSLLEVSPSGALYATPVFQHPAVVFRSLDQGEHWARFGSIPDATVRSFGFAPDDSIVLAGTDQGLFRKKGIGARWVPVRPGKQEYVEAVAVDPVDPNRIYAGLNSFAGVDGMLKSSDKGETWKPANDGLGGRAFLAGAIAPSNPKVIYASVLGYSVVRSSNGGATWRVVSPASGVIVDQLAVDPRDENRIYAASGYGRFWRSRNGGASWIVKDIEDGGCAHPASLTVDPRNPDRLLLAGFLETGCARGHETSCLNLESTDAGATWSCLEGARDAYLPVLVSDPRRPETLYGAGIDGVSKSTDGGESWTLLGSSPPNASSLVISPQGTLWAGSTSVFRSRDGGLTWRRAARGLPADGFISDLVRAPSNPSVLYAVVLLYDNESQSYDYDLYGSKDGGVSWRRISEPHLPALQNPSYELLVDPRNPGRLYAGTPLGLYRLDKALD